MDKRREWELSGPIHATDFYTHILGGEWTATFKRKAYDGMAAMARGGAPTRWARKYGMHIMATFAYSKYGDPGANLLVVEWTTRMQHFYDLYVQADAEDFEYTEALIGSYEESQAWKDFVIEVGAGSHIWERAHVLRCVLPEQTPRAGKQ